MPITKSAIKKLKVDKKRTGTSCIEQAKGGAHTGRVLVSFFANKYYHKNKYTLVYLSASVVIWSFVVTTVYFFAF